MWATNLCEHTGATIPSSSRAKVARFITTVFTAMFLATTIEIGKRMIDAIVLGALQGVIRNLNHLWF
jgi:hypothetical protein